MYTFLSSKKSIIAPFDFLFGDLCNFDEFLTIVQYQYFVKYPSILTKNILLVILKAKYQSVLYMQQICHQH